MVTDEENIKKLAENLEKQELDAPGGVPAAQVYSQLLAIYLYQYDFGAICFIDLIAFPVIRIKYATPNMEGRLIRTWDGKDPAVVRNEGTTVWSLKCNAKYLWKRIPQPIKGSNPELTLIWNVGQKMWQRDYPGVYAALNSEWSENVSQIMRALHDNVRKRAVHLVANAYSSISLDDLASFVGMAAEQAAQAALEQGWQVDDSIRMVNPCRPKDELNYICSSEDQLYKLTEYVSFLEN